MAVIAFDVYGTLVDPAGMAAPLGRLFGTRAALAAQLWREKQLEYTFRRALMRRYVDFNLCTAQALRYVGAQLGARLGEADERALLGQYLRLPAFPDVAAGLPLLQRAGHVLLALSNGTEPAVRTLLQHAGVGEYFHAILSADQIGTFKPDPAVYDLVAQAAGQADSSWLVSANPFDVIGAKARGLKVAWLRRDAAGIFDPWEFQPDLVVRSVDELRGALPGQSPSTL